MSGIARLHAVVGRFLPKDVDGAGVRIGIETDHGPWVAALVASGYQVYAVNPLQSARARQGNGVSGATSDAGDALVPPTWPGPVATSYVPSPWTASRPVAVKGLTRMYQALIWEQGEEMPDWKQVPMASDVANLALQARVELDLEKKYSPELIAGRLDNTLAGLGRLARS